MKVFSKINIQKQFGKSRLVTCINIPNLLKNFQLLSFEGISYKEWISFEKNMRLWLEPFINLNGFPYLYPTSGILGGLDYSMAKTNKNSKIFLSDGEFEYISKVYSQIGCLSEMHLNKSDDILKIFYFSNPSAISGKFIKKNDTSCDEVWMDIAYIGTTFLAEKLFLHPKTTKVFFSLNKAFGISSFRIGFLFCKYEDSLQKLLLDKNYINSFGIRISDYLINRFHPLWLVEKHAKAYSNLIDKYNLEATDTILLAESFCDSFSYWKKSHSDKIRIPTGYAINKKVQNER